MKKTSVAVSIIVLLMVSVCASSQDDTSKPRPRPKKYFPAKIVARPTLKKTGWWVLVDTCRTRANSIALTVGTKKTNANFWRSWKRSDPIGFDVPDSLSQVEKIYLQGGSEPKGEISSLCVFYQANGVKRFEFAKTEDHQLNKKGHDAKCK